MMPKIEVILFWVTLFTYVSAFFLYLFGAVNGKESWVKLAFPVLWAGLLFHTAVGILRWVSGGHPPFTDTYELNLTGTWFTMLLFLLFHKLRKVEQAIALLVIPVTFIVLGYGMVERTQVIPMGPAFQSPWLVVHVVFAWLAFGSYAIATGAAILLLMKEKKQDWQPAFNVPDIEALDVMGYRFIVLGFINHAVMLISGAIWAKKLWGHYWSWDPLETWSLIAFLYYALCLHTRSFLGWKMKRAAWMTVLGLLILIVSFWGVKFLSPSPHPGP
jgi:cytochrome c-type biogenesis protein CcsB